ncbi:13070_t:CDS:2 [Entrophospora sp. SA101]|nr:13070_t:CDS:2 [Entrophospora sp. SA101]
MSSQSNANSEIEAVTREARTIDEFFDSIYNDLISIDQKSKQKFASKWKVLKDTWREILQESRDEASRLVIFMQNFAKVVRPSLQDIDIPIQVILSILESYIKMAESYRSKAEKVRKKFYDLSDDIKIFLASYDRIGEDRVFHEVQVHQDRIIKTKGLLSEALLKWISALAKLSLGVVSSLGLIPKKKSYTTNTKELNNATNELWDEIKDYHSNWVDRKEHKRKSNVIENTCKLGNTMKSFDNIWGTFSSNIQNLKKTLDLISNINQPRGNNGHELLLRRHLESIFEIMNTDMDYLKLYAQKIGSAIFGFDAKVDNDPNSKTKNVTIYNSDKYTYVDTPGFDDSNINVDNKEMFIEILTKLQEQDITEIHTVLWFVEKGDRGTRSLQRQARFIESFAMNSKIKSNIWNNVIVIIKGENSNTGIQDINAVDWAVNPNNVGGDMLAKTSFIHVYLHDRLSEYRVKPFTPEELHEQGIYKKEELFNVYKKMIQEKHHAENPIKVTFKDAKCVKCGKETDIRLAEKYPCHTKEINHKHPSTEIVHTGYVTTQNEYRKFGDRTLGLMVALSAVLTVVKTWQIRQNAWGFARSVTGFGEDHMAVPRKRNTNLMPMLM